MQPYFLPYIGYFQLIHAVDSFVVYDDVKYTKRGWINRNRFLSKGKPETFSVPLQKDSDSLSISQRRVSEGFRRDKLERRLQSAYARAPFSDCFPLVRRILNYEDTNLFGYLLHSLKVVCEYLGISTPVTISSTLDCDQARLRSQEKVLAICEAQRADHYLNPIGGLELYQREAFAARGIELSFLRSGDIRYSQGSSEFVPSLSILDVMMFNSPKTIREFLGEFTLE
jgi:WbqC-like protein family